MNSGVGRCQNNNRPSNALTADTDAHVGTYGITVTVGRNDGAPFRILNDVKKATNVVLATRTACVVSSACLWRAVLTHPNSRSFDSRPREYGKTCNGIIVNARCCVGYDDSVEAPQNIIKAVIGDTLDMQ